jgi:hypothetical protein
MLVHSESNEELNSPSFSLDLQSETKGHVKLIGDPFKQYDPNKIEWPIFIFLFLRLIIMKNVF